MAHDTTAQNRTTRQEGRGVDPPYHDGHVVVVGMMAAGKTTLGRALAKRLGTPYLDSDDAIVARYGRSGRELAAKHGVDWLHDLEAEILIGQLADLTPSVISAAASAVDAPHCVRLLRERAFVCWVDVPATILTDRWATGEHRRPMDIDELQSRLRARVPVFESVADVRVDGTLPLAEQVNTALAAVAQRKGEPGS